MVVNMKNFSPPKSALSSAAGIVAGLRCSLSAYRNCSLSAAFAVSVGICSGFGHAVRDRRGVSASEYALLAVGIVIVVGAAVVTLGDPTRGAFAIMGNAISSTQTSLAGAR